jgi:exonuclease III
MGKIIQWNCRSLRANYNELLVLQQVLQPAAFCLQELLIDASYVFPNRQYNLYSNSPVVSTSRPCGGVGIAVLKSIPHSVVALSTALQVIACRISIPRPITVCSVYLPPTSTWNHNDLLPLVSQLPSPVMLVGDFNAHNSLWGSTTTDWKGTGNCRLHSAEQTLPQEYKRQYTYTQQQALGAPLTCLFVIPHFSQNMCGRYMMINVVVITIRLS